jgi:membrane protein implicated in regulation of membrane protease activity
MAWLIWLLVGCGFGVGEMLSAGSFYLAPFAIGAALAAAAQAAVGGVLAWIVFVAVSVLSLATVRPLITARLTRSPGLRTGAAALIGQHGRVLQTIDNRAGIGQVRIESETWTARSFDEDRVIEVGTDVEVVAIRGATAIVME